jgi:twitching motility protein PilT
MPAQALTIQHLLEEVITRKASDLHLTVGAMPMLRVDGSLVPVEGTPPLSSKDVEDLCFALTNDEQKDILLSNKEVDFSFALGEVARFRVNLYHQKGYLGAALRFIPTTIRTIEQLGLPNAVHQFSKLPQGFVLVTGPTGHGKSTTLAAMINQINQDRAAHIITIEDPIEYVYPHQHSLITQRELHLDTHSWDIALRSVLREDPDVVLVGEMRDFETISAALTVAETGHLVFATLHTNSAAQTVDRVIDVFPEHQQAQVRTQLAGALEGIVSQRLIPALGGGRVVATEILTMNAGIRSVIREGKTHQIDNLMLTGGDVGMISLERSLANLIQAGKISLEEAKQHTLRPSELDRILRNTPRPAAAGQNAEGRS